MQLPSLPIRGSGPGHTLLFSCNSQLKSAGTKLGQLLHHDPEFIEMPNQNPTFKLGQFRFFLHLAATNKRLQLKNLFSMASNNL